MTKTPPPRNPRTPDPPPAAQRSTPAWWLATSMLTGAIVMGLEIVSFRLYAPYLGYSIYVWGTMISAVMAALSLGYAVGGWLADRSKTDVPLYVIITAGSVYQSAVIAAAPSVLTYAAGLGEFAGTLLATLVIFAPPMAALAITGPFVIRLLARTGHIGATAGKVYALSTVGSIAGILAASFYLVPAYGTQRTLAALCGVSAVIGLAGLAHSRRSAAAGILLVPLVAWIPQRRWSPETIWHRESAYNLVRVVRTGSHLALVLDAGWIHTSREGDSPWTGRYYDRFVLGPLIVDAERVLVLGMGAGGSIVATRQVAPHARFDAVEIDPVVVEAAERFFDLRADGHLTIHVADARPWLMTHPGPYDLIHVDLYQGGPYVPFYLLTVEFFELLRDRLAPDGLVMLNVVDVSAERSLMNPVAATLLRAFASVSVLADESGNHTVFAARYPDCSQRIRQRLAATSATGEPARLAAHGATRIVEGHPPEGTEVFTDDHSRVEQITHDMVAALRAQAVAAARQRFSR